MRTKRSQGRWIPLLSALLLSAPSPARAAPPPGKVTQASDFFDAGAQAYKAGQYLVAAEAFLKAHELAPSPPLLFSAAQAYRRQYLIEPLPGTLRRAIGLYQDYLRADKNPKRREDAMQALSTLIPIDARIAAEDREKHAEVGAKEVAAVTRLLLSTPTDGAEVSVDGGAFAPAPVVAKVEPGLHAVRVRAPGYDDEELTVQALPNELVPRHVPLRPKPSKLHVVGTAGARVAIDGQVRATVPFTTSLSIEPGVHFVSVTLPGHKPFAKVVELGRAASMELTAELVPTRQRIVAWATLGVGAAGAVTGAVLTGLAIARQEDATGLSERRDMAPLTPEERDRYNNDLGARDNLARAAAITSAAAAITLGAGVGLFVLDKPEVVLPNDDRLRTPPGAGPRVELEVGVLSVGVRGAF